MSGHKYQVEFLPYREGPWSNSDGFVSEFFVFIGDAMQRAEQLVRDSLAEEAEVLRVGRRLSVARFSDSKEGGTL